MNAASQRRLTPVLIAIAAVLLIIWLTLLGGVGRHVHWNKPRQLAAMPPVSDTANLPTPRPLQDFASVWQKPLFSPDRKPLARIADGGTSLGDLTLTGIILTPGLHMALLHDKNGDRQIRLREGEAMPDGSVKLVEVRARSALFDASSGRTELKLPAGAPFDGQKPGAPADAGSDGNAANAAVPADAVISIGPHGAGRQPVNSQNPSQNQQPQTPFLDRIRQNNQRRRAERAAASH